MQGKELIKLINELPESIDINNVSLDFIKHYSIIKERKDELIELENRIAELKNAEFKKAISYFKVMETRKLIQNTPSKHNNYDLNRIEFIKDIKEDKNNDQNYRRIIWISNEGSYRKV